jgi:hypothetical protein
LLGLLDLVQFFEDGGGFGHGKPPITIPSHKPKSRALAAAGAANRRRALRSCAAAAGAADVKTVSAAALSSLLDARVLAVEGIYSEPLLAPFVRHYADAQKTRIAAVVRQGVAQGLTNAQILQRVIGTKKAGRFQTACLITSGWGNSLRRFRTRCWAKRAGRCSAAAGCRQSGSRICSSTAISARALWRSCGS